MGAGSKDLSFAPWLPPHLRALRRARPHLSTQRKSSPSSPRRVPPPAFGSSRAAAPGASAPRPGSLSSPVTKLVARTEMAPSCLLRRVGFSPGAFGLGAGAETELTSAQGADARSLPSRAARGPRGAGGAGTRGPHSQLVANEPLFSGRTLGSKWLRPPQGRGCGKRGGGKGPFSVSSSLSREAGSLKAPHECREDATKRGGPRSCLRPGVQQSTSGACGGRARCALGPTPEQTRPPGRASLSCPCHRAGRARSNSLP